MVHMDLSSRAGLYDAPFPSDHRLLGDGTVDLGGAFDPGDAPIIAAVHTLIHGTEHGFSTTAGVFFSFDGPLDGDALPSLAETLTPPLSGGATVFLVDIDPDSPERGRQLPLDVGFEADPGPLGAENLLSLVPLQGLSLRPGTRYAAGVMRGLGDADGALLGSPEALTTTWLDAQTELGLDARDLAALTVFTTGEPAVGLAALGDHARSLGPPQLDAPLELIETHDAFCVYESTLPMPVYQQGTPPYLAQGGGIEFSAQNEPVLQRHETARIFITVPRSPIPNPAPTAVMIRTGGGGDRPLIDRGPRAEPGGEAITTGTGPAAQFAQAGFVGVQVDGPLGGLRNTTGGDEQFLIFNIANPAALRDNLRQSSLEIALLPEILDQVTLDIRDCEGAGTLTEDGQVSDGESDDAVPLNTEDMALLGHSMGATIAPGAAAIAPAYGALILSGAGGSWIENVIHKRSPLEVRPIAESMLGYSATGRTLTAHDPFLSLLQWGGEAADPPVYGAGLVAGTHGTVPHVLMVQGIVDTYILPPIANVMSLGLALDQGGAALDEGHEALGSFRTLAEVLPYSGGAQASLPASGNRGGEVTAIVVQHGEDGVEDGHEVLFQLPAARDQMTEFLRSWRGEADHGAPGDGLPIVAH
jgi:hypothetical protein